MKTLTSRILILSLLAASAAGQRLTDGTNLMDRLASAQVRTLNAVFDGGGSALSGTITRCTPFNFAGVIQSATMIGDATGSATVDVRYASSTNYNSGGSSAAASITGSAPLAISGARLYPTPGATPGAEVTGWTTALSPGVACFVLSSASSITNLTVSIKVLAN